MMSRIRFPLSVRFSLRRVSELAMSQHANLDGRQVSTSANAYSSTWYRGFSLMLLMVLAMFATACGTSTDAADGSASLVEGDAPRANADGIITLLGTVERVWEDGFELRTEDKLVRVDSWEVFGDATAASISVGQSVEVTGEFENGEFDAVEVHVMP